MILNALIRFRSRHRAASALGIPRTIRHTISLCRSLLSERGEISGGHLATEALQAYHSLDEPSRAVFFDLLVKEFSPAPEEVGRSGEAYRNDPSAVNLAQLLRVVEPPRQELFRRLNMAPGGIRTLLEMRSHLLRQLNGNPQWASIEADLAHLLTSWFNRGFLIMQRIDWRTPAIILEKLIRYEAVHEIQGWSDLRRRLEKDRRCYGFFHPALEDEPIIFLEVALTHGMSARVQPLLDPVSPVADPKSANCAVFYSITNCQEGLRGIPFGNLLIKKVVEDLGREVPQIRTFATVSPVPGFRQWLEKTVNAQEKHPKYAGLARLAAKLAGPEWLNDKRTSEDAQHELGSSCAYYLLHAKQGKEPLDSVARFHLRNGARLERINWLGDTSAAGIERSAGLMVNYVYRLADVEQNHELYMKQYKIVASRQIESLAKESVFLRRDHSERGLTSS
jgi:malonyl-CoA decarboxylase